MSCAKFIVLPLLVFSHLTGPAQELKAALDSLFSLYNKSLMGCLAISKNGKVIYAKSVGYSIYNGNVNSNILTDEKTKYRIGSISKTFASAILFQLMEEGKLSLSDRVEEYFPKFRHARIMTIQNLMTHTSGIPNFTRIKNKQRPRSRDEMLRYISRRRLEFYPGTKTSYSNANYLILGYIIEKITNQSYETVLNDRIIKKVGLHDTYYGSNSVSQENESLPYSYKSTWQREHQTHLSIPGASGGIISTPVDLVRFIEALFSYKLVNASSLDMMKTIRDSYGMGMMEFAFHTKKALGQIGGIDNYQSVLAYFPADSLAIAFCSNGQAASVRDVVLDALNIYYGRLYDNSSFRLLGISKKPKGLEKYTGIYSNKTLPLTVTISTHNEQLIAQPVGLSPYELKNAGSNKFKCEKLGIDIHFNAMKNSFTLTKGNMIYNFSKEN